MTTEQERYEGWTIVELMGHRRVGGHVSEIQVAGAGFLRVQVFGTNGEPIAEQLYSPSAIYCLTPTTEGIAKAVADKGFEGPVHRWELPTAIAAPRSETPWEVDDELIDDGPCEHDFLSDPEDEMQASRCRHCGLTEATVNAINAVPDEASR